MELKYPVLPSENGDSNSTKFRDSGATEATSSIFTQGPIERSQSPDPSTTETFADHVRSKTLAKRYTVRTAEQSSITQANIPTSPSRPRRTNTEDGETMAASQQHTMQTIRALVRPRYRANWIIGKVRADGFTWYIRGTNFPMSHEEWLRSLVHSFRGELFVDVGAHVGTWAIRAARSFRKVVAFEPNPDNNQILRTNLKLNQLTNNTVIQNAISNAVEETSSQSKFKTGGSLESRTPVRTLDSFGLRPSFIKIDTEGDELHVLEGSLKTLNQRPRLVIETHDRGSVDKIRLLLEPYSYSIEEIQRLNRFNQTQSWLLCN